jgi:hypothetical protein
MNLHLTTPELTGALMSSAMATNTVTAEISAACMGLPVQIDSATACELWAARIRAAAAWAPDARTKSELLMIADQLGGWRTGGAKAAVT